MAPGILYVTIQPKPSLPEIRFQDWYNNEHGPNRLRLSFCTNGFRFRATDLGGDETGTPEKHAWMAVYDLTDVSKLDSDEYKALRGPPVQTQREIDLRPHLSIDRRSFDLTKEWAKEGYQPLERIGGEDDGGVVAAAVYKMKAGRKLSELDSWYEEEHVDLVRKVPGWRRTRCFVTSAVDGKSEADTEFLVLHDFDTENGLAGSEILVPSSTPRAQELYANALSSFSVRLWTHHYTLGPAPRHLSTVEEWTSPATRTRTIPAASGTPYNKVESYVTTPDGAILPYTLEGSSSATAPVVLCINSILTHSRIYNEFTTGFLLRNPHYRILRYHTRGRSSQFGTTSPITIETLTNDALTLLDALRISQPALVLGVSLGGATALSLGLYHPTRVPAFLACDTNSSAPPINRDAWTKRIAMAEEDEFSTTTASKPSPFGGATGDPFTATITEGERVVGLDLADATVERWFVPESFDGGRLEDVARDVSDMVRANSLEGFKASVNALYEYDFTQDMGACTSRGEFLVGAGDGKLPEGMKGMAEALGDGKGGKGVKLTVVEGAGHLPMVERPDDVVAAVEAMLKAGEGSVATPSLAKEYASTAET